MGSVSQQYLYQYIPLRIHFTHTAFITAPLCFILVSPIHLFSKTYNSTYIYMKNFFGTSHLLSNLLPLFQPASAYITTYIPQMEDGTYRLSLQPTPSINA